MKSTTMKTDGPRAATLELFRAHGDSVYRAAYGVLGSHADAQDATQEVFLYVLRKPIALRGVANPRGWLMRAAVNTARKQVRGAGARARREEEVGTRRSVVSEEQPEVETHTELHDRVRDLPPKLRLPVVLHYFEDLSYEQVAEVVGCSSGTVGSRLHRAKARLREQMVGAGGVGSVAALDDLLAAGTLPMPANAARAIESVLRNPPPLTDTSALHTLSVGKRMAQGILATLAVTAIAAGGWFLMGDGDPGTAAREVGTAPTNELDAAPRSDDRPTTGLDTGARSSELPSRTRARDSAPGAGPGRTTGEPATPAQAVQTGFEVKVLDESITPVEGVTIGLSSVGGQVERQVTGADGIARFGSIRAPGRYRLESDHEGFRGISVDRRYGPSDMRNPGFEIEGKGAEMMRALLEAERREQKAAAIEKEGGEPFAPQVQPQGREVEVTLRRVDLEGGLEVRLIGAVLSISGRVLDPKGVPVSKAVVMWRTAAGQGLGFSSFARVRTDAQGRFRCESDWLQLQLGTVEVLASHPDWAWAYRTVALTADQRSPNLDLTLTEPSTLTGRVRTRQGSFVAARIEVVPAGQASGPGGGGDYSDPLFGRRASAGVGRDGEFRVTRLPPGKVDVMAIVPGYRIAWARGVEVGPDLPARVEIVAERGGTIRGRFVDGSGQSVSVSGILRYARPGKIHLQDRTTTFSGRTFELSGLEDGTWDLRLRSREQTFASIELNGVALGSDLRVRVVRNCTLIGRLTTPAGAPELPDQITYLIQSEAGSSGSSVALGLEGAFVLAGIDPRTTQGVTLSVDGYLERTIDLELREGERRELTVALRRDPDWKPDPADELLADPLTLAKRLQDGKGRRVDGLIDRIRSEATKGCGSHPPTRKSKRPDLVPVLAVALEHERGHVRTQAICALAYMNHPATFPLLKEALEHEDGTVRYYAVMGLGWLADEQDLRDEVVTLHERVRDDSRQSINMRISAAENLVGLGLHDDPALFVRALKDEHANEALAAGALAALGRKDAVELIVTRLRTAVPSGDWHLSRALKKLTGEDFGTDYLKWKTWLEANRAQLPEQLR